MAPDNWKIRYQVLEAANGQEALELALDHVPDVVLLGISMPVLDGFGLAAALQTNERTRELPLIFLTSEDDPLIKAKAFETGRTPSSPSPSNPRPSPHSSNGWWKRSCRGGPLRSSTPR